MRAVWPQHLPMSVRISAHDWVEGGITPDDAVEIARAFKAAGADLIDCSSGQVSKKQQPVYGRMYQTPFADRIRNEAGIATIAVGAISEADHVNSIIAAGRADLCAVARPHLANPAWTLLEAAKIGVTDVGWPKQYRSAKTQLERNLEREKQAAAQVGGAVAARAGESGAGGVDGRVSWTAHAKAWPGGRLRFDCGGPAARDCPAMLAPGRRLRNSPLSRLRRERSSNSPRRPGAGQRPAPLARRRRVRRDSSSSALALPAAALLGAAEALRPPPGHAFASTTESFVAWLARPRRGGGGRLSARLCGAEERSGSKVALGAARAGEDCLSSDRRRKPA